MNDWMNPGQIVGTAGSHATSQLQGPMFNLVLYSNKLVTRDWKRTNKQTNKNDLNMAAYSINSK